MGSKEPFVAGGSRQTERCNAESLPLILTAGSCRKRQMEHACPLLVREVNHQVPTAE